MICLPNFIYCAMVMALILLLCVSNDGVIIVDNVWFYGDDHKTRVLNTGDIVQIYDREDDMLKVKYDNAIAKIHEGVLIDLSDEIAEDKLFLFSCGYFDEKEYKKSALLFNIFIKNFNKSKYLDAALYYCGLAYEEAARQFGKSDSLQLEIDQGLSQHCFIYNKKNNQWNYDGSMYQMILEKYPKSIFASKATYRLLNIFRMKNQPWDDSTQKILNELKMWQEFSEKYQNSEEYVLAMLEIGYLNRVLFEITKGLIYKNNACNVFQEVVKKYPDTIHSAQARVNLYELEKGEYIYK